MDGDMLFWVRDEKKKGWKIRKVNEGIYWKGKWKELIRKGLGEVWEIEIGLERVIFKEKKENVICRIKGEESIMWEWKNVCREWKGIGRLWGEWKKREGWWKY